MKETAMSGSSRYEYGKLKVSKISGSSYKSAFLGYKCKAPKGGIFSTEEDLLRMSEINTGLKVTDPVAFREAYYTGKAVVDMFLSMPSGADVAVYWQYYPANMHGGNNVARLVAERQIQVNRDKGWIPEESIHTRKIMGREFLGLTSQYANYEGEESYIKEYFYECPNGMITVTANMNRYTFAEADLLLDSLKEL